MAKSVDNPSSASLRPFAPRPSLCGRRWCRKENETPQTPWLRVRWGGHASAAQRYARLVAVDVSQIDQDLTRILFSPEKIEARMVELAAEIDRDYAGKDPLLVGVLNGAVMVMADLSRALTIHCRMDWMAISSYGSGTKSSGVVRILKDLSTDISGMDVLVVEDIVDTGLTLSYLISNLMSRGPASLKVLTALRKPEAQRVAVDVAYVGFDIPNEFVVGYGLDYNGHYRNLTSVGTLSPHVYS